MTQELLLNNGVRMPPLGFGVFQSSPEETAGGLPTQRDIFDRVIPEE